MRLNKNEKNGKSSGKQAMSIDVIHVKTGKDQTSERNINSINIKEYNGLPKGKRGKKNIFSLI